MHFDFWVVAFTLQPFSLKKVGLKAIILFFGSVLSGVLSLLVRV